MQIDPDTLEELKYGRLAEFVVYHFLSDDIGDIDPSYPMLRYVCDRFELNLEQRYWLAFLFAATYCAPTVYYIYNEFPDYENVDVGRLERWWFNGGREKSIFQSDRRWIRSRNQFVELFTSYRDIIGPVQEAAFQVLSGNTPSEVYDQAYNKFINIKHMGRFSMFLYLESVYVVTGFPMYPTGIDWYNAQSSRNGLCYAIGRDEWLRGKKEYGNEPLEPEIFAEIDDYYEDILDLMLEIRPYSRVDAWNVETTMCAYKKWHRGKRYPGYYLDRQHHEISKLEEAVADGVDWSVLWDFRRETYDKSHLKEYGADNRKWSKQEMDKRLSKLWEQGYV